MEQATEQQQLTDDQKLEAQQAELLKIRTQLGVTTGSMSVPTNLAETRRRTDCLRCGGPLGLDDEGQPRLRQCADCDKVVELEGADYARRMSSGTVESNLVRSGLPRAYVKGDRTLADLPRSADDAVKACLQLGKELSGLYLFGPAKAMKTSVAAAFLASQIRELDSVRGVYVSAPKLMDDIIASYHDSDMERRSAIIDRLIETPMVVIDDLGKEKATEHSARVLFEVFDGRFQNRGKGRWTIVTSNYSPKDVAFRFDIPEEDRDPIRHRLAELTEAIQMRRAA